MHPLVSNLSELSNEELHKKYNELTQKMNQAHRFGPTSVIPQMQMILENYRYEMDTRNRKLMEEMEAKNDKFKDLIDIKK
jgi:energy-converting hydrogenase A subunit M